MLKAFNLFRFSSPQVIKNYILIKTVEITVHLLKLFGQLIRFAEFLKNLAGEVSIVTRNLRSHSLKLLFSSEFCGG